MYIKKYITPSNFSDMFIESDGEYLTGLWFIDSKDSLKHNNNSKEKDLEIFRQTEKWLDIYFSGGIPDFTPNIKIENLTPFRSKVIEIMNRIPYGKVITYGDISNKIALDTGIGRMSSQAVGGAVGWNPICIIIPCHRVVGAKNNLTGYGGGLKNKIELLKLEKNNISEFIMPK